MTAIVNTPDAKPMSDSLWVIIFRYFAKVE